MFSSLLIGRVVDGRYVVKDILGSDGLSWSVRVADLRLGRQHAMKVLNVADYDSFNPGRHFRSRFRMGADIGASLPPHPGIVPIYDYGTDSTLNVDYIVTELLKGEELSQRLKRSERIPLEEAIRILHEAASALAVAHRGGIVHCDVKPSTIFLTEPSEGEQRRARITDFGVAKRVVYDPDITADPEGQQPFTPRYAAPELLRQEPNFTYAVDVFGLGMVGFEMLTRTLPFSGKDRALAAPEHSTPIPSLRDLNPAVSSSLEQVIRVSLDVDPEKRYPNAFAFLRALEKACSDEESLPHTPAEKKIRQPSNSQPLSGGEVNPRHNVRTRVSSEAVPLTPSSPLRVFLCHASEDKASIRQLYRWLQSKGVQPWLDEEELLPGQNWQLEIRRAVRDADLILVCLSRRSVSKAGFVQKEIKFALDIADEQPEGQAFLVPLRLEDCAVPERLTEWQWLDFWTERAYERLLETIELRRKVILAKGDAQR